MERDPLSRASAHVHGPKPNIYSRFESFTPTKVDETISQDRTDNNRVDPLARDDRDGAVSESSSSDEGESPLNPGQQIPTLPPPITKPRSPSLSTVSRKSSEDLTAILKESTKRPEDAGPEYETLREAMKSIPGLEFYKDRDYCRVVDFLLATIAKLKVENAMLKTEMSNIRVSMVPPQLSDIDDAGLGNDPDATESPRYEVFHQVNCVHPPQLATFSYFQDAPLLSTGDTVKDHLRGQVQIPDLATYFEEHEDVAFIVSHVRNCGQYNNKGLKIRNGRLIADFKPTEILSKNIALRPSLVSAIKTTMNHYRDRFEGYDIERIPYILMEPFVFLYTHNQTLVQLSESSGLEACDRRAIQLLCSYFEENWKGDWDEADCLLSRGKINKKHYTKLFRPGELVVTKSKDGEEIISAMQVKDYPLHVPQNGIGAAMFRWEFNGQFRKLAGSISHQSLLATLDDSTEVDIITSLDVYPLRFSHEASKIKDELISRGLKFWRYRKQALVCYMDQKVHEEFQAERRFMIDYTVFRRMHSKKEIFETTRDDLGQEVLNQDEPPSDNFLVCLPAHIHGYDLSEKAWKLIRVDRTTDVTWNKNIFKQLVLPTHNKELIQAVVTAHGQKMSGTADIIGGKGQGILLLLHGGPGTGKTLTAEGIAEEQERPLYRVTCGDIGTEPEVVEQYLKYVLEIGRAWGCVVLLDEADVFLEERSPADHKRNAIISIFLRVLEYYDGILILTTNRVGSFDEAFKSRIHLSLGYPNLNEEQREQIWRNFFRLLDRKNERFDIHDLELNVQKLAKHEINGGQIRNTVMMARHLAKFRKEALVYKHVQEAVATVVKFNEYLQAVKGASDDDFAEYDRLRARITG